MIENDTYPTFKELIDQALDNISKEELIDVLDMIHFIAEEQLHDKYKTGAEYRRKFKAIRDEIVIGLGFREL